MSLQNVNKLINMQDIVIKLFQSNKMASYFQSGGLKNKHKRMKYSKKKINLILSCQFDKR